MSIKTKFNDSTIYFFLFDTNIKINYHKIIIIKIEEVMIKTISQGYKKIKNSKTINFINKNLSSGWGIAFFGLLTILAHIFSLEMIFYLIVGITTLYICLFGDDLLPLTPLFLLCYITPTAKNNPGLSTDSIFYNKNGTYMILILCICIPAILLRIGLDKNMGYKKLFTQKRYLLSGMCFLGLSYILSGIGSKTYPLISQNNLVFSLLQFLSIFLLYYIFTATVDWKKTNKDYFAWMGIIVGLVVSLELLNIYIFQEVIQNGSIIRSKLYTGWGHYNNMGALIAMSIPFAFYLASKKKHNYLYLILGTILLMFLFLSCSRGSIVCGLFVYIISFIITFFKSENKKTFRLSSVVLILIGLILGLIFKDLLLDLFKKVPSIISSTNNSLSFNDSSRFEIYKQGFDAFLKYPIFGQSFYATDFVPYDFSIIESFSTFFPPRWHNTIIQILSSCGIFGMIAYLFHRIQTIKLIVKKPSLEKTFIGLSILALLLTSLLDCHFFNIGPTMFYSILLAFAESINTNNKINNSLVKSIGD